MNDDENKKGDDKITLTRSELKEVLDGNKNLVKQMGEMAKTIEALKTAGGGVPSNILRQSKEKKVNVRFIDDKPVIGFSNRGTEQNPLYVYSAPNPKNPTENLDFVDVKLDGVEKPLKLVYTEFLREASRVECLATNIDVKEWVIEQGTVTKKEIEGYGTVESGFEVPMEVVGKTRVFTVQLPNGDSIELDEAYVNI